MTGGKSRRDAGRQPTGRDETRDIITIKLKMIAKKKRHKLGL